MPIDHLTLPLETPRLRLREFRPEDFDAVHLYGSDPEVARYMPWGPNTPADTQMAIQRSLTQPATWPRLDLGLAIESRREGVVIGSIALHLRDANNLTAEFGYCLRRDHWGQGVVTEAAQRLLSLGFETFGLHRIIATCDVRNTGSYRVMEKLGMRREGRLLQDRRIKGEWRDTYLYALLRSEWDPRRRASRD